MAFTQIDNKLLHATNLSGEAKYLASLLMSFKEAWPGYDYLTTMTGWQKDKINKTIKELIATKIISKQRRFRMSNFYTVLPKNEWIINKEN